MTRGWRPIAVAAAAQSKGLVRANDAGAQTGGEGVSSNPEAGDHRSGSVPYDRSGDEAVARRPDWRRSASGRWPRFESVFFWSLVPVGVAALIIFGALLTGRLVRAAPATSTSPSFSISVSPNQQRVTQGSDARYIVSLQAAEEFTDAVELSLGGATGHFSRERIRPPASTVLTVTTSRKTIPGSYPIRVIARSAELVGHVRLLLIVRAV